MSTSTDDKILSAAAELFGERGYVATTTKAIAERAGVNEVTLFRRFENKAGVLRALGDRFAASQAGIAAPEMPAAEDTRATIDALARMEVDGALRDGGVAMRLAFDAQTVPEVAEFMAGGPSANLSGLTEYFRDRQAAGDLRADVDPHVMAEMMFAVTSTLVMSRQLLGHSGPAAEVGSDEMLRQITDVFWSGVKRRTKKKGRD